MSWTDRASRASRASLHPKRPAASARVSAESSRDPFQKTCEWAASAAAPFAFEKRIANDEPSNVTIDDLAARIVAEHKAVRAAMKSTLEHAMACGDLLIEAKAKLEYGKWLPWLAEHCASLSERTAQVYISLAKNRAAIEAKSADAADLTMTIRDALELIARQAEPPFQSPRYPVSHQVNIVASNRSMPSSVKLQLRRLRTPSTGQAKHKASGECSYPRVTSPPPLLSGPQGLPMSSLKK